MRIFRIGPAVLLLTMLAGVARAETPSQVPNPRERDSTWVSDAANVLTDTEEARINDVISSLESRTGAEIAVVTVNNLGGQNVEEFALDLFNTWKIGKREKDNGVLILAAIQNRKVRIEVGYGLEGELPDGKVGEITRENILPNFRAQNYFAGLLGATLAVRDAVPGGRERAGTPTRTSRPSAVPQIGSSNITSRTAKTPVAVRPTSTPRPYIPPPSPYQPPSSVPPPTFNYPSSGSSSGSGLLFLLGAGGLGMFGLLIWALSRPRKCPRCQTVMEQLSETEEGKRLTRVQMLEQRLGSRDYKIWRCPQCAVEDITQHDSWFSSYENCPTCGNKTLHVQRQTTHHPTQWSEGQELITSDCEWEQCNYRHQVTRTLPRLPRNDHRSSGGGFGGGFGGSSSSSSSSSRSGGSFGGGSSGGGGSSSSW